MSFPVSFKISEAQSGEAGLTLTKVTVVGPVQWLWALAHQPPPPSLRLPSLTPLPAHGETGGGDLLLTTESPPYVTRGLARRPHPWITNVCLAEAVAVSHTLCQALCQKGDPIICEQSLSL